MKTKSLTKSISNKLALVELAGEYGSRHSFTLEADSRHVGKSKVGRPRVITQQVVGKLEQAFMYDCTVEEACVYAGIHKDTYYEFCKQYPEFSDRIAALRFYPVLVARRTVINAIVQGNARLAMKYLERKRPQEFSSRASNWRQPTHSLGLAETAPDQQEARDVIAMFVSQALEVKSED